MEKNTSSGFGSSLWGGTTRSRLIFVAKVLLVLIPVILFRGVPFFTKMESGEYMPVTKVIEKQLHDKDTIFGSLYSDETVSYKTAMVKHVNPEVLALGNSKIMTMRSEFFNKGVTFYNAGGVTQDIAGLRKFLEETKEKPSIIIITVEPLHFDPSVTFNAFTVKQTYEPLSFWGKVSLVNNSWIYNDPLRGTLFTSSLPKNIHEIGLNALLFHDGIRSDGSYHYGERYSDEGRKKYKLERNITQVSTKINPESQETFSSSARNELDTFLAYCKERNIYVIGYIPPIPEGMEVAYKKHPQYTYVFQTYEKTAPIFQKYHFTVYNFLQISSLGGSEDEFIDGYHTSERTMLRTLIKLSDDKMLSKVVDKAYLQKLLTTAKDGNDVLK